jgi:serine/threonine protein kinase
MTCPSCNSPLEPNARFCGVCGYRLAPNRRQGSSAVPPQAGDPLRPPVKPLQPASQPRLKPPSAAPPDPDPAAKAANLLGAGQAAKQPPRPATKSRKSDDVYLGQVLNNRFKVESKIGEGGFGAVYRGVQLATGRKVALKLLHPDMTKDDNLVARFRREGMVLCNLRDAHTITTYDFDQTPSGTLYIAMELLEGKSLHQVFHEEAPLDWKRVFKILSEMCSSLAEAHDQGIVHRDLKPENIYLESRSGNPEFVKILDFGIAKVMRGETIDPQSPQLTATGQTLGTLEYMSPEQLMGKPLDGRSDVYALGVLAYEMITGRLPFPDAKGPAGLITAQLKQTPAPPSQAYPKAMLPRAADRAILKCLEKDKTNRYPDVTALAAALQEAISSQSSELSALKQMQIPVGANRSSASSVDLLETRRGELPNMAPPPMPAAAPEQVGQVDQVEQVEQVLMSTIPGVAATPVTPVTAAQRDRTPLPVAGHAAAPVPSPHPMQGMQNMTPPVGSPSYGRRPPQPTPYPIGPAGMAQGGYPHPARHPPAPRRSPSKLLWWVIALLAIGAGAGTVAGLLLSK